LPIQVSSSFCFRLINISQSGGLAHYYHVTPFAVQRAIVL